MRPSTERLIKDAPALRKPDEVLDALQWVSLKHPQRLKVQGVSSMDPLEFQEGRIARDVFFHPDFSAAHYFAEYQSLERKYGFNALGPYFRNTSHPFTLSEAMHALQLTGEARWAFDLLRSFGVRDGLLCTYGRWFVVYSAEQPLQLERSDRYYLSMAASVAVGAMERFVKAKRGQTANAAELSDREKLVLRLLAEGLTADEIAGQLHIGTGSVRTYIRRMLEKLGAHNSTHAVSIAWRSGLFDD